MILGRSGPRLLLAGWLILLASTIDFSLAKTIRPVPFPDVLTLEQALEMLDQNYPDVMAAKASIKQAEAKVLSVQVQQGAKVSIEAELRQADRHIPSSTDFIDDSRVRLVVKTPLSDFGMTKNRLAGANISLDAKQIDYQKIQAENRLKVIEAFLEVILSDYAYIVADEEMTLAFLQYDRELEKMERYEDANPIKVAQREVHYLDKFAVRSDVDNERRNSRLRLSLLLNRPDAYPDQMVEPDLLVYDRPVPDYDEILPEILLNSPQMKIARLNIAASEKRLQSAKMLRPTLGLQFEAIGYSESYAGSRDDIRASAFLRVPIYSKASQNAEIVEAMAELDQYNAQLNSIEYELRIQVLELVQKLKTNQAELNAAYKELEFREHELDRIRLEYELDYRASIGEGNLNVAKALYRVMRANYEKILIWEQLDMLTPESSDQSDNS
ncbi:MAG: TolC family protein [Gammaproteobacteria bacterium]|nr:TolC family protein [Gammaproteobacteria bacterium]MCY4219990.1 TolC family protein [Gammaproteobacteria bacterium]MCY4275386.1 TolC family protein [Gammaproteobacteria bacterium]